MISDEVVTNSQAEEKPVKAQLPKDHFVINENLTGAAGPMTIGDAMSFAIRKALTGETWFVCKIEDKIEPHVKITYYLK